jgi:hypothetical protein
MMAVPASIVISGVEFTNDLVYEKPKGDLILFVQHKLQNMGLSQGRDRHLHQQFRSPVEFAGFRGRRP